MAFGVTDICETTYEEIKMDKKFRYIVFFVNDEKQIDVETVGARDAAYDQFLEDLQKGGSGDECRYGLFDFEYTHQCQGTPEASKKKLFLMMWCPDTANLKKKTLYSFSFNRLWRSLVGVHKYIQATDASEAAMDAVEAKLRATDQN